MAKPTPPPGIEAKYFEFGRFSIAVPAGWTATKDYDEAVDATVARVKNPSSPEMVTYDSFVGVDTQAGVIMRMGAIKEDWEADQGEFNLWRDYYTCELAHQTRSEVNIC